MSIYTLAIVFGYLDALRESGVTNMYGVAPYLDRDQGLERDEARTVLRQWLETFSDDPPLVRARLAKAQGRTP